MFKQCRKFSSILKTRLFQLRTEEYTKNHNHNLMTNIWPKILIVTLIIWFYRVLRLMIILVYYLVNFKDINKSPYPYIFDFVVLPFPQLFHRVIYTNLSPQQQPLALNSFICFYSLILNTFLSQNELMMQSMTSSPSLVNSVIILITLQTNIIIQVNSLRFINQSVTLILLYLKDSNISLIPNLDLLFFLFLFITFFLWQLDTYQIKISNYKQFQKDYLANLPIALCILNKTAKKVLYVNKQIKKLTFADLATSTQYLSTQKGPQGHEDKQKNDIFDFFTNIFTDSAEVSDQIPEIGLPAQDQIENQSSYVDLATVIQTIGNQLNQSEKNYCFKSIQISREAKLTQSPYRLSADRRFLDVRIQTGLNFGEQMSIIITLYDTSSNLQSIYYKNLNSIKSKLIKSISHELRTRLNIIQGMIALLINSKLNIEQRYLSILQATYNNCQIQTFIIGGIIDYNLIQENQITSKIVRCSLKNLISDAVQLFQEEADLKNIKFDLIYQLLGDRIIYQDASRIMICLVNLISNSLKFSHKNSQIKLILSLDNSLQPSPPNSFQKHAVKNSSYLQRISVQSDIQSASENSLYQRVRLQSIRMRRVRSNHQLERYKIQVIDEGIGICKEKLYEVEQIVQGKDEGIEISNKKVDSQGIMLGIRVMARILNKINEEEGQWLSYESQEQVGTAVTLIIKSSQIPYTNNNSSFKQESEYNSIVADSIEVEGQISRVHCLENDQLFKHFSLDLTEFQQQKSNLQCDCEKEILLVDDESYNLFVLEYLFNSTDQKVLKAENGLECLEIVQSRIERAKKNKHSCKIFKAIFMDYQMPLMDGAETTEEITRLFREMQQMRFPIIGCTGLSSSNDIQMLLNAGMNEVLTKPISKTMIEDILYRIDNKEFDDQLMKIKKHQNIDI